MTRVTVLGAGRVGSLIARDLARDNDLDVTAADASAAALDRLRDVPGLRLVQVDLSDPAALAETLRGTAIAVGAVPGPMGFETVRRAIAAGCHVVDISFFEEDARALDDEARTAGRTVLVDCGVAPGCSNLILGRHEATMLDTESFHCVVGGLPVERRWPWEYKAPFSPIDVIAEYTRPARIRRDGHDLVLPALSEVEPMDFPGLGTLEAFNTDGLRTLLHTCRTPTMVEKTLRYPGHAEKMRILRESGFFGESPMTVGDAAAGGARAAGGAGTAEPDGAGIAPLDLTSRLLFHDWRFQEGEADLTVMRVDVVGTEDGHRVRHRYSLLDHYDAEHGVLSMARTTGYTCTAMTRLVARGLYAEPGVSPPEIVAWTEGCFDFVMQELAARGVSWHHTVETLD